MSNSLTDDGIMCRPRHDDVKTTTIDKIMIMPKEVDDVRNGKSRDELEVVDG